MWLKAPVSLQLWNDFGCRDSSENEGGALLLHTYTPLQCEVSKPQHCWHLDLIISVPGICVVCSRIFSSIPGLSTRGAINIPLRVPIVAQWQRAQLVSMASLSGLRIWRRRELRCRSQTWSDPTLLWLWCRMVAIAPIWPLAWEFPYAMGVTLKRQNRTKKSLSPLQQPKMSPDIAKHSLGDKNGESPTLMFSSLWTLACCHIWCPL